MTDRAQDMNDLVAETFENLVYLGANRVSGALLDLGLLSEMLNFPQQPLFLSIISAPSVGRSALAGQMFRTHAREGRALYYSIDLPARTLCMRLMGAESRMEGHRVMTGQMNEKDLERVAQGAGRLVDRGGFVIDAYDMRPADIVADVAQHAEQGRLGMVIIDGLELLNLTTAEKDAAILAFRTMSRQHGCVVVLTLPVNTRGIAQRIFKRPYISDVQEVTNLEPAADIILGVYRDEMYNSETDDRGVAEVIVLKNKNGPVGRTKVLFNSHHVRFNDQGPDGV